MESAGGADGEDDPVRRRSIWPHVEERVLDLIEAHRSTIVFANSRRLAERLCGRLNELATERAWTAADSSGEGAGGGPGGGGFYPNGPAGPGTWPGPGAAAALGRGARAGLGARARLGARAGLGSRPGSVLTGPWSSRGRTTGRSRGSSGPRSRRRSRPGGCPPWWRPRAWSSASTWARSTWSSRSSRRPRWPAACSGSAGPGTTSATSPAASSSPSTRATWSRPRSSPSGCRRGAIEELRIPRNPLDVLAQQVVAMAALDDWPVDELEAVVRRAAPFSGLTRPVLEAVLDMLAGRYPGEEFAGLQPRVVWDRVAGVIHGRPGAQRLAVTSGGTIPDRGYFGVFLPAARRERRARRAGSASSTRRWCTSRGSATCSCSAPRRGGSRTSPRTGCWCCPRPASRASCRSGTATRPGGRPSSARRSGPRSASSRRCPRRRRSRRCGRAGSTSSPPGTWSGTWPSSGRRPATCPTTGRWWSSGSGTSSATGGWCCTPPTATGCTRRGRWPSRPGCASATAGWTCRRCTPTTGSSSGSRTPTSRRRPGSRCSTRTRSARSSPPRSAGARCSRPGSASARPGRCCSPGGSRAGAPRSGSSGSGRPSCSRSPAQFPGFPITLETVRECLQDVFDVPALTEVLRDLAARRIRLVEVETATPSPFGRSLLFRYVGAFMYEGDAPLAERRAQALALDPALLAELLGTEALRELLDPAVVAETEADLQHLSPAAARPRRRGGGRPAAHVGAADRRGGGGPVRRPRSLRASGWPSLASAPADHRGAGGRAADVGGDRGRRAAAGRARGGAAGRHPRGVHRAAPRPAGRPGGAVGADARPVHRRRRGRALRARAWRWWR